MRRSIRRLLLVLGKIYGRRLPGAMKKVLLVRVAVETMGGREFEAVIDQEARTVMDLKRAITEAHGVSSSDQVLFLLKKRHGSDEVVLRKF